MTEPYDIDDYDGYPEPSPLRRLWWKIAAFFAGPTGPMGPPGPMGPTGQDGRLSPEQEGALHTLWNATADLQRRVERLERHAKLPNGRLH